MLTRFVDSYHLTRISALLILIMPDGSLKNTGRKNYLKTKAKFHFIRKALRNKRDLKVFITIASCKKNNAFQKSIRKK